MTPLIIALTVAYFLVASVTTFDIRMIQAKREGTLPPDEPMPPAWVAVLYWMQWSIFLVLLYLNWKYALALFVIKFVLKVLPVLEIVGNVLMSPFKRPAVGEPEEMTVSQAATDAKARTSKMTPEERSESARNAVRARWAKKDKAGGR